MLYETGSRAVNTVWRRPGGCSCPSGATSGARLEPPGSLGPGSARAASTPTCRESPDAVSEMRRGTSSKHQRLQQRVRAGQVHMRGVPGERAHDPWRGIRSVVSESSVLLALPMRKFTRFCRTSGAVFLRCALHIRLRRAVRYFSVSRFYRLVFFKFVSGSSSSPVKSSVLLALPMRKSFLLYTKNVG